MIQKVDILKMVQRVHRASQGLPPRRLIYPDREWALGVVASLVLVVGICVGGAVTYLYLSDIPSRITPVTPDTVRYQENTVARALEVFDLRADRFTALTPSVPVVPSVGDGATSTATTSESAVGLGAVGETSAIITPGVSTTTPNAEQVAPENVGAPMLESS